MTGFAPTEWDYAAHLVAMQFLHRRLSDAMRDRDYAMAQVCIHNMRQHLAQIEKDIAFKEVKPTAINRGRK